MLVRAWILAAVLLAGCVSEQPEGQPIDEEPPGWLPEHESMLVALDELARFPVLQFETDHGTIQMILYADWLPQTTAHIGGLAEQGFYDGTIIHRVVDDFVIQGGDPTGTGEGGSGPLGLSTDPVPLEVKEGLPFVSGSVGLARWTEDTGDSQWFIAEKPALHLSNPQGQPNELLGPYALFGQVFEGMDVVHSIAAVETLPNDRPIADVVLQRAAVIEPVGVDYLNLIRDPVEDFQTSFHVGILEVPRVILAGHPATFVFTTDGPCEHGPGPLYVGNEADVSHDGWVIAEHDACTFKAGITFHEPGTYTISATDVIRADTVHSVHVDVRPWNERFAPYTGTVMNDA